METTKSKPVSIKTSKPLAEAITNVHIGTCRSYDEKRPIPSFIRQLGVTANELPGKKNTTQFDLN